MLSHNILAMLILIVILLIIAIRVDNMRYRNELNAMITAMTGGIRESMAYMNTNIDAGISKMKSIGIENLNELYKINILNRQQVTNCSTISDCASSCSSLPRSGGSTRRNASNNNSSSSVIRGSKLTLRL